jgi:hypothetical protein
VSYDVRVVGVDPGNKVEELLDGGAVEYSNIPLHGKEGDVRQGPRLGASAIEDVDVEVVAPVVRRKVALEGCGLRVLALKQLRRRRRRRSSKKSPTDSTMAD